MNKVINHVTCASFQFEKGGAVRVEPAALTESQVKMSLQRMDTNHLEYFMQKRENAKSIGRVLV